MTSDDRLKLHGRLSTHVLDNHSGKPASGMELELIELSQLFSSRVVRRAVTNSDGRTDAPLIGCRPVPIGRYELKFAAGKYFCGPAGVARLRPNDAPASTSST